MRLRSILFVPADSDAKFAKASACGADALILDLEDAVAPPQKAMARGLVAGRVATRQPRGFQLFVRINALDTGLAWDDLAAAVGPGLDAIVLPKAGGAADVAHVAGFLDDLERKAGLRPGQVRIVVVATETPAAIFNLSSYSPPHPRLLALTWGAEDLATAVGASANKGDDGGWTHPYQLARSLCLFAARAAGVAPLDTIYADFRDEAGLAAACRASRRDGFVGKLAIHPAQVATINQAFTASEAELAHARRLVELFEAQPEAGALGIDGQMYDVPHLKAARALLAAHAEP